MLDDLGLNIFSNIFEDVHGGNAADAIQHFNDTISNQCVDDTILSLSIQHFNDTIPMRHFNDTILSLPLPPPTDNITSQKDLLDNQIEYEKQMAINKQIEFENRYHKLIEEQKRNVSTVQTHKLPDINPVTGPLNIQTFNQIRGPAIIPISKPKKSKVGKHNDIDDNKYSYLFKMESQKFRDALNNDINVMYLPKEEKDEIRKMRKKYCCRMASLKVRNNNKKKIDDMKKKIEYYTKENQRLQILINQLKYNIKRE